MSFNILKAWNKGKDKPENVRSSYNMLEVIQAEHARVHDGLGYSFSELYTVGVNGQKAILYRIGEVVIHLRKYEFEATAGPGSVVLYESPFIDVNSLGTLVEPLNMNRESSNVSSLNELRVDPFFDVNSLGTQLHHGLLSQSTGGPIKGAGGGAGDPPVEWMLPSSKEYLLVYTNSDTGSVLANYDSFWYEEN